MDANNGELDAKYLSDDDDICFVFTMLYNYWSFIYAIIRVFQFIAAGSYCVNSLKFQIQCLKHVQDINTEIELLSSQEMTSFTLQSLPTPTWRKRNEINATSHSSRLLYWILKLRVRRVNGRIRGIPCLHKVAPELVLDHATDQVARLGSLNIHSVDTKSTPVR